jgi:hypothetical protein
VSTKKVTKEEGFMAYTYNLEKLIRQVEETRPRRFAQKGEGREFPTLSLAEKETRLRQFHLSYKEGALKELETGPSKGCAVAPEICSPILVLDYSNPLVRQRQLTTFISGNDLIEEGNDNLS